MRGHKRNGLPIKEYTERLHVESLDIRFFLADAFCKKPGVRTFVNDLFAAYKKWRKDNDKIKTVCSLDSFGHLLPKGYERMPTRNGSTVSRAILGYQLTEKYAPSVTWDEERLFG